MAPARHAGSRTRRTVAVTAVLVVCALPGPSWAAQAQAAGAPDVPSLVVTNPAAVALEGIVSPDAASGPNAEVGAVIELIPRAGSAAAVARLAASGSTLSRAQRTAALQALAPAASAEAATAAWATSNGLRVTQSDRWLVGVSGSAAAMSAAFATRLVAASSRLQPAGPATYLRPATAPRVPAALAGLARTVTGLDTRPVFSPRLATQLHPSSLTGLGFTGDQLRDAYGVPRDPAAGNGVTVGTIQFSGFNAADLSAYSRAANIPLFTGQLTEVSVDGANPATVFGSGDIEVDLDTQAILAMAPLARQRAYFAPNSLTGEIDAFTAMADDAVAGRLQVVSSSWGHCEADLAPNEAILVRAQIQRLVAAGATISASSGDSGSNDCGGTPAVDQVDFPTSIPEVVSVGGTSLTSGYQSGWSGSGGGASTVYPKPAYQSALPGTHRMVPDVALLADPQTGFAVMRNGTGLTVGGTSLASPLFAGLLAGALSEADRGTGVGDVHAALYSAPAVAFQDVLTGTNGSFSAGAGYDEVTGLGAPRFGALATAMGLTAVPRTSYHPIDPTRIADSRTGAGVPKARLGAGQTVTITVAGSAGVPATGVTAAVVNVTAINPTVSTYLTAFPTGAAGATATSSVNAVPGTPTPNLVTVKTDASGRISVFNRFGTVDLAVDLAGYYARDSADFYTPLSPARVMDTRSGKGVPVGRVGPGGAVSLHVEGAGGVPASGVAAVTLNVTAVDATASTHVAAFPSGFAGGPLTSNLNIAPARAVANAVIAKVSAGGDITFSNAFGAVDLVADVEGYYAAGAGQSLVPVSPVRIFDVRPSVLLQNSSESFAVSANGSRAGAVVLNLTGVQPTEATYLSIVPANVSVATGLTTSSLNLSAHEIRANLTTTAIAPGQVPVEVLYNFRGSTQVVADLSAYFSAEPVVLAQTSVTESAPAAAAAGTQVTFSAAVTAAGPWVASLAPGAVVDFVEPGVGVLGAGSIAADGSAAFSTSALAVGTHTVYAIVAAHDGIAGSTSTPVTVTVS